MKSNSVRFACLRDLRQFVQETLCRLSDFEPGAFRFTERLLVRGSGPCGYIYCVHGPRNCKVTAIWETQRNQILFYGSAGERLARTEIAAAPSLIAESAHGDRERPARDERERSSRSERDRSTPVRSASLARRSPALAAA